MRYVGLFALLENQLIHKCPDKVIQDNAIKGESKFSIRLVLFITAKYLLILSIIRCFAYS